MSISINTNAISLSVQRSFNSANSNMNTAMERMSTGYKINSASDNAAGYSVSKKMESIISTYSEAETNGQMGSSLLQTQEGVLEIINTYLQRIRDLTEQASNGTYATSSRTAISSEVAQRMSEVNRLCKVTDFNGLKLLDGSQTGGVNLQVGVNSGSENTITLDKSLFKSAQVSAIMQLTTGGGQNLSYITSAAYTALTSTQQSGYYAGSLDGGTTTTYYKSAMVAQLTTDGIMVDDGGAAVKVGANGGSATITAICNSVFTNDNSARDFLDTVDKAIENVSSRTTEIGAYMNRVDSAIEGLGVQSDNLTEANSLIKDADVAKVSSQYISYQILQKAAATMLTTANQTPSVALSLMGGQ